jgi:hypothetical protein
VKTYVYYCVVACPDERKGGSNLILTALQDLSIKNKKGIAIKLLPMFKLKP